MRRPGHDEWLKLIAEYEKSGLQQKEFVEKHDLSFSTFQYWLYRRSKKVSVESGSAARFLPVEVIKSPATLSRAAGDEAAEAVPAPLELELPGQVRLRFAVTTPAGYLAELIKALR